MTISSTSVIKKMLVLFLVVAGLHYAKAFLMPMAIGGVLATLFLPFCKWMESKNMSRGLAATICLLLLLLFIAGIGTLLTWQISELVNDIDLIKQRALDVYGQLQQYVFAHFGITMEKQSQLIKEQQTSVTWMLPGMAISLASVLANFFLTLVYVFGLLFYRGHIKIFLLKLVPNSQEKGVEALIYRVAKVSQQYLLGLSKMIVLLWVMYGIGFSILGIKNALFFAILCGILEIVPFIGNITGTTITVLVAAVQGASLPMLVGVVGTYGIVQFIQGWVLEPLIVGSQVKINPLFTIIALIVGELIWGIPGIFLAIPLIAMFKIICDHIDSLKPYGFLIGEIANPKNDLDIVNKIKDSLK